MVVRPQAYPAPFLAHVGEALTDWIRDATNGNLVLGKMRFPDQVAHSLGWCVVRGNAGRPVKQPEVDDIMQGDLL